MEAWLYENIVILWLLETHLCGLKEPLIIRVLMIGCWRILTNNKLSYGANTQSKNVSGPMKEHETLRQKMMSEIVYIFV